MSKRFSKRYGYKAIEKEIAIRNEAPVLLREFIIQLIYDLGHQPSFARKTICRVLRIRPDSYNFSEHPNIDLEVNQLIQDCQWYHVYDIIEAFWDALDASKQEEYQNELNDYFKEAGIGWKLEYGLIEFRGEDNFELAIRSVEATLHDSNLPTAKTEIKEAILDLSRRPEPDITGAIQHSLACLECVSREVAGDRKATLGDLIKKYPDIIPKPLDKAIEKVWGFSSEQGRHLKEGGSPEYNEAELLVGISAAISTYLAKKLPKTNEVESDLPF